MGCLSRLFGLVVLAALAILGWFYRDRIIQLVQDYRHGAVHAPSSPSDGRPGTVSLRRARDKIDSLNAWRADSVVLTASETASLVRDGIDPALRQDLDSLQATLERDVLSLSGRFATRRIPKNALGPFGGALNPWEPVTVRGGVRVARRGTAAFTINRLTIRNFPLPATVTRQLVERSMAGTKDGSLEFAIPAGVDSVRVRPGALVLYRGKQR
ncbi:MAG: hypothetical protein ABJD11_13060 [Gemmatimonadota bacterium]